MTILNFLKTTTIVSTSRHCLCIFNCSKLSVFLRFWRRFCFRIADTVIERSLQLGIDDRFLGTVCLLRAVNCLNRPCHLVCERCDKHFYAQELLKRSPTTSSNFKRYQSTKTIMLRCEKCKIKMYTLQ